MILNTVALPNPLWYGPPVNYTRPLYVITGNPSRHFLIGRLPLIRSLVILQASVTPSFAKATATATLRQRMASI